MEEIKVIKEDERQKITLVCDTDNNKLYIQRHIHCDKTDIYKTLQKIHHPNIPEIISVELTEDTIVIEQYIEGKSLAMLMEENTVFSNKQIKSTADQLVAAMKELHDHGIIHRDIKPDNIIINETGHIWLIDYDIARIYREEIRKDTEAMGTFGYAPIEQYGMLPTNYKTDIYALGVTLTQLLDHAGKKGHLYKIAEKCKRLDPSARYRNTDHIKRALALYRMRPALIACICALAIGICGAAAVLLNRTTETGSLDDNNKEPEKEYVEIGGEMVELTDELLSKFYFEGFEVSAKQREYMTYDNYTSIFIFNIEDDFISAISFVEDMKKSGKIFMGKKSNTEINAELELKDGVFSVSLSDPYGNTFAHDFEYTTVHSYRTLYTKNRRVNAEIICKDMDGDHINELLIGICDCSFTAEDKKMFVYFNYSQGWCLKYNEARGFVLCDCDMFSANSKFSMFNDQPRIYLPSWAAKPDDRRGYKLDGDTVVPFY